MKEAEAAKKGLRIMRRIRVPVPDVKYSWKDIRNQLGMKPALFADLMGLSPSNYSRKETYERKMNASELRDLINRFEWLNVNNVILTKEELDEYLES